LVIAAALLAGQPAAAAPPPPSSARQSPAQEEEELVRWWRDQGISEAGVRQLRARQRVETERTLALYSEGERLDAALRQAGSADTVDAPRIGALLREVREVERALGDLRASTFVDELLALGPEDRKVLLKLMGYRERIADPSRPPPARPPR